MSIITRYLAVVVEPDFLLARDLTALAIADGEISEEEREAIAHICHLESVDVLRLLENLRAGSRHTEVSIPTSRQEKNDYLKKLILLIGADGYCAPQEIYLFQIFASKMGLTQMEVVGLFLLTATRQYFRGDIGAKVLSSFLKNQIDPHGKSESSNRDNLRTIYETIAANTEHLPDEEADMELLRENLECATDTLTKNHILARGFANAGLNFDLLLKEEEVRTLAKYMTSVKTL